MEVVNPFNRVPETEEALARGCGCFCSTGSEDAKKWAWIPFTDCHCSCDGDDTNLEYNKVAGRNG